MAVKRGGRVPAARGRCCFDEVLEVMGRRSGCDRGFPGGLMVQALL